MKKTVFATLLTTILVTACSKQEELHDVAWWVEHNEERITKANECYNNPPTQNDGNYYKNCVNVESAEEEIQKAKEKASAEEYKKRLKEFGGGKK
ncbi:MAG: EexN family lipoprotein [Neisseriaceae bacterium]|nr:EexN family lipoprotein [Neisseriaceae bacterium]MBR3425134.1 EexN family lipoprotein [Neisseriaceae bacterium]